jgi:hypothetical protein
MFDVQLRIIHHLENIGSGLNLVSGIHEYIGEKPVEWGGKIGVGAGDPGDSERCLTLVELGARRLGCSLGFPCLSSSIVRRLGRFRAVFGKSLGTPCRAGLCLCVNFRLSKLCALSIKRCLSLIQPCREIRCIERDNDIPLLHPLSALVPGRQHAARDLGPNHHGPCRHDLSCRRR